MRIHRVQQSMEGDIGLPCCRAWHETCEYARFGPPDMMSSFVPHRLGPDLRDATTVDPRLIGAYG